MENIVIIEMEKLQGGDFIDGFCVPVVAGEAVLLAGAAMNWWNPAGWVMATGAIAAAGCAIYWAKDNV